MRITEAEFRRLALQEPDAKWELFDGEPRRKPCMTWEHNHLALYLAASLIAQLDVREYQVRSESGHVQRPTGRFFIPDVFVVPMAQAPRDRGRPGILEEHTEPLPLVVEVWSTSTGRYDVLTKLATYRERGDLEIWFVHPYDRTITIWRRQPDGTYTEITVQGGRVQPSTLPNVTIDFDALFEQAMQ
jgi:Uma2 family endonuclease